MTTRDSNRRPTTTETWWKGFHMGVLALAAFLLGTAALLWAAGWIER